MKELIALVETNLRSSNNKILGEEKRKRRILYSVLIFIFSTVLLEFLLVKTINILKLSNSEILFFNSIINMEFIIIAIIVFFQIMNTFYLASDWKEKLVYPIKTGSLVLSKCIMCYFSSILISLYVLIPLFTYGVLTDKSFSYYLYVVLYQVLIASIPTIYFTLLTLTVFWIIAAIKKTKSKHRNNKFLSIIDLVVVILTYMLLKPALNGDVKINNLLLNIFFNGNSNLLIVLVVIIIGILGVYFIGGNVYLKIMKSGMFTPKDVKKIEANMGQYEFELRSPVVSNIIRDIKLIIRIPVLRTNCVIASAVLSLICLIMLIVFRNQISSLDLEGRKCLFAVLCFLFLSIFNSTSVIAFSREGRALHQFKVFPIDSKKFLLSKICVGVSTNIFAFISTNVLMILISSSFIEFFLIKVVVIAYMIGITVILIAKDLTSMELKWVDINDLLMGNAFKILIPYYILTILPAIYPFAAIAFDMEMNEYVNASFMLFIIFIYSLFGYRKIKKNIN